MITEELHAWQALREDVWKCNVEAAFQVRALWLGLVELYVISQARYWWSSLKV